MFPFTQYPLPFLGIAVLPLDILLLENAFIHFDHNSVSCQRSNCILNEHVRSHLIHQFKYLMKIPLDDHFVHVQLWCNPNMSTLNRSEILD